MADIFVSYSRTRDTGFVDRLASALSTRGYECWVDREAIFPSSPWRTEIQQAILETPIFLFVISSSSVASEYCLAELGRAAELNKRLVPVVAERVPDRSLPPQVAELQFIDFSMVTAQADDQHDEAGQEGTAFAGQLELLATALSTDLESVHFHTRLLTQAERWQGRANDPSLLLRGRELTEAERWLDERVSKGQAVLPQQQRLVRESRQAAIRRQRGSVTVALAIAAVMALLAVLTGVEWHVAVQQRHQAEVQKHRAEVQRDRASSLYLAQESQSELPVDPQLALLLGLKAYDYTPTLQAESAVRAAVAQSSLAGVVPGLGSSFYLSPWPFDPGGRWLVASYPQAENAPALIKVAPVAPPRGQRSRPQAFMAKFPSSYVSWAQFDQSGTQVLAVVKSFPSGVSHIVSWAWRQGPRAVRTLATVAAGTVLNHQGTEAAELLPGGKVEVAGLSGGRATTLALSGLGQIGGLMFSPDGHLLAIVGAKATEVWYIGRGQDRVFPVGGDGVAAFSPDDNRLAVAQAGLAVDVLTLATAQVTVDDVTLPTALASHCCDVDVVQTLAWSPDSTTLAAGTEEDPVVWLWPGAATTPVYLLYTEEGTGGSLAFSPDGRDLLDGDLLWAWDTTISSYYRGDFTDIAFWPGRDAVAGSSSNGGLLLWDWKNYEAYWLVAPSARTTATGPYYTNLQFSPDGRYLVASIGDLVEVWRLSDDRPVARLVLPHGNGWGDAGAISFSPNAKALAIVATASIGPTNHDVVLYWHWLSSSPAQQLELPGAYGYLAGFTGSEVRILSTPAEEVNNPSRLLTWDGVSGSRPTVVATIGQRADWDEAAVLPDGEYLLADQAGIVLYDPKTKHRTPVFQAYEASFVLSPKGGVAAITSSTGFVYIWDLRPGDAPVEAFKSQAQFPFPAWGATGTQLGLADAADGLRVMSALPYLPFSQVLPAAKRLAVTSLSPAEQRRYLP